MSFGASFTGVTFFQAPFATGARNGASVDAAGNVVLGNDVGEPGSPAQWLSDRESDTNGFSLSLIQAGVDVFTQLRVDLFALFNGVDNSEVSMAPGIVSLVNVTANNARLVLGANQANESEVRWDGAAQEILFGDVAIGNNLFRLLLTNGNIIIGPAALVDNGSKLQVDGHVSMRSATANLDFPITAAQTSSDLTIALPLAVVGDMVALGVPPGSADPDTCYTAFVDAAGSVTVRFNNYSAAAVDPAAGDFTVSVLKPL